MSLELVIFLIVAAVAIFAAAFMLVSRNAVHSALFLVTNMISLAFMYLLLNAPFLAMVQITVYAGAIMVLFMFVIMLLGSEKLGEAPTRYRWLPLAGVAVATVFLITAYFAIAQGSIGTLKPVQKPPQIRVVNVGADTPKIAAYLNNDPLADEVGYREGSAFKEVRAGDYNLVIYNLPADGSAVNPGKDAPAQGAAVSLKADTATTVVVTADRLIVVPQDLSPIDKIDTFRFTVVNALPGSTSANFLKLDPNNPNPAAADAAKYTQILAPAMQYGDVHQTAELDAGDYAVAWEFEGQRVNVPERLTSKGNAHALIVLYASVVPGSSPARTIPDDLTLETRTATSFGGPTNIGEVLFTSYLLPFELVSLLLLVAMVGAIIMTREQVVRRERKRVVVSKGMTVRRMNKANAPANALIVNEPGQNVGGSAD